MSELRKIVGNEEILLHIKNAIKAGKVSHAYVLNGANGMGKTMIANYFATLLQCDEKADEPCGKCHSCKQAATDNQPDIIWVRHERPLSIGVRDIIEQVVEDVQIKPYSSPYKIYIIDEAEMMTIDAQNALLKTLEEPPEYAIIFLLTNNITALLPTILSRCVTLKIKPVPAEVIKKYLMEEHNVPEKIADSSVAFAYGNIGKALRLSTVEEFGELKSEMVAMISHIEDMDIAEVMAAVKRAESFRLEIGDYLDLIIAWFRDVLLYKASQKVDQLIFKEEINEIKKQAAIASYAGIGDIISSVEKAKERLKANVSFSLVIELLYLSISENLR